MNCLEIITILFSFFSCLHFDCFLGKIYIASNLPCCQMQKTTICPMPCADNFEQLPYGSNFMFERCQPNGSLNKEESASSAFIVDYLLHDCPGVMKVRRVDESIIVGRSENPSSRGTTISSSDCLLVILSEPELRSLLVQMSYWGSYYLGLPRQLSWKRICLQCRRPQFDSWIGKTHWRRDRLQLYCFVSTWVCWSRMHRGGTFSSENDKPANLLKSAEVVISSPSR